MPRHDLQNFTLTHQQHISPFTIDKRIHANHLQLGFKAVVVLNHFPVDFGTNRYSMTSYSTTTSIVNTLLYSNQAYYWGFWKATQPDFDSKRKTQKRWARFDIPASPKNDAARYALKSFCISDIVAELSISSSVPSLNRRSSFFMLWFVSFSSMNNETMLCLVLLEIRSEIYAIRRTKSSAKHRGLWTPYFLYTFFQARNPFPHAQGGGGGSILRRIPPLLIGVGCI